MHVKKRYIVVAVCVFILLIASNAFQFVFWGGRVVQVETAYSGQVEKLEHTIGDIGPIVDAWTVAGQVSPGQLIVAEDLKPLRSLQKSMGETYITDLQEIIGKFYKVSILPGTPITKDVIMQEKMVNSLRQYEVVANTIPIGLKAGDYIDFRFVMAKGEDYIAIAHKRVEAVYGKTITLHLTEEEIHVYQSVLIDYFLKDGSFIYMTKYTDPGVQEAAKPYYPVYENILTVMNIDPNILERIETAVVKGKRDILAAADKAVPEDIRTIISGGRTFIQSNIDSASAAFSAPKGNTNKDAEWQDGGDATQPVQQQTQAQPPQGGGNQFQRPKATAQPANIPPPGTSPSGDQTADYQQGENGQQGNGNENGGSLNIQEGVVE